jgi:hypothetical protein
MFTGAREWWRALPSIPVSADAAADVPSVCAAGDEQIVMDRENESVCWWHMDDWCVKRLLECWWPLLQLIEQLSSLK